MKIDVLYRSRLTLQLKMSILNCILNTNYIQNCKFSTDITELTFHLLLSFIHKVPGTVDGDGKGDSSSDSHGVDTNGFPIKVYQWSSRITHLGEKEQV